MATRLGQGTLVFLWHLSSVGCQSNEVGALPSSGGSDGQGGSTAGQAGNAGNAEDGGSSQNTALYDYVQLTAGPEHTCARLVNGAVKCWGQNGGWLGLGDHVDRGTRPSQMGANLAAVDLGKAAFASVVRAQEGTVGVILQGGAVKCWGNNSEGQLGQGDVDSRGGQIGQMGDVLPAIDLGDRGSVVELAVGGAHVCARFESGQVSCWGSNTYGELGLGDTESRGDEPDEMGDALPSVDLGEGRTALMIAAGARHTCALLDDHTVKCWGQNSYGELGVGDSLTRGDEPDELGDSLERVSLGAGVLVRAIHAKANSTCAVLENRQLKCWGNNDSGQLGLGDYRSRGDLASSLGDALPEIALGEQFSVRGLAMGHEHVCALSTAGLVKCWGRNDLGQLGLGSTTPTNLPMAQTVDLGSEQAALEITAGRTHSCATLVDGGVKCWGGNSYGQLGQGSDEHRGDEPNEMGDALSVTELE